MAAGCWAYTDSLRQADRLGHKAFWMSPCLPPPEPPPSPPLTEESKLEGGPHDLPSPCLSPPFTDGSEVPENFPVIVTSYEIIIADAKFLQQFRFKVLVVDEGHRCVGGEGNGKT